MCSECVQRIVLHRPIAGGSCGKHRAQSRAMYTLVQELGIESWKPVITALLLPPVPFLLIMLWGALLLWGRRAFGWLLTLVAVTGLWLCIQRRLR